MKLYKILLVVYCLFCYFTISSCDFLSGNTDVPIDSSRFNNFDKNGEIQLSKTSEFIVVIPDIQLYTVYPEYHELLDKLIERIIEIHKTGFNIKIVLQVGDTTEKNSKMEWESAKASFLKFDGLINYILCTGNHDYGEEGTTNNRQTSFNTFFQYMNNKSFRTNFEEGNFENSYFQFSVHKQQFQLFSLEFGPRDTIVAWASNIAKQNRNKVGIVLTHAYLSSENERYDYEKFQLSQRLSPYAWSNINTEFKSGNVNDGQQIWDKLIFENNIKFAICGHRNAANYLISKNSNQQDVLQLIFAEHRLPQAVEGWIQILEFYDDKKSLGVKTYSTLLNTWKTDSNYQYNFTYN